MNIAHSGSWLLSVAAVCLSIEVSVACAMQGMSPITQKSMKEVVVTEKDDGKTVAVARDALLVVKLESQLGTGYGWDVEELDTHRLALAGPPTLEVPDKKLAGQREFQIFKFEPKESGHVVLKLRYVRSWEKPVKPAKTFTVNILIGS
jgi:predicted secreted protein